MFITVYVFIVSRLSAFAELQRRARRHAAAPLRPPGPRGDLLRPAPGLGGAEGEPFRPQTAAVGAAAGPQGALQIKKTFLLTINSIKIEI